MNSNFFHWVVVQVIEAELKLRTQLQMSQDPAGGDGDPREGSGTQTLVKPKPKLTEPSMYKVVLLNDDFTPMDFVVLVLTKFFLKSTEDATRIMLQVHHQGSGVAGTYTHEVAETKVYLVNDFSRKNKHPLKCVMEKA